nr:hypothetical protein [uncultured Rhodopila sp.]
MSTDRCGGAFARGYPSPASGPAALLNEQALNALRAASPDDAAAAAALAASLDPADLVSFTRQAAPLSRQQRRATERQAENAEQCRQ